MSKPCGQGCHDFGADSVCRNCGAVKRVMKTSCTYCGGSGFGGWNTAYNVPEECHICYGSGVEETYEIIFKEG